MSIFFITPVMTPDQRRLTQFLYPLLAGFSTFFLGGTALLELTGDLAGFKVGFSATAGIAVFVLCYVYPPYFLRTAGVHDNVEATRILLSQDPKRTAGGEVARRKKLAKELYLN